MKKKNFLSGLFVLLVCGFMAVSCGSDNEAGGNGNGGNQQFNNPYNTGTNIQNGQGNQQQVSDFLNRLNNANNFAQLNSFATFTYQNFTQNVQQASNDDNCDSWAIFYWCNYSSGGSSQTNGSTFQRSYDPFFQTVQHEMGNNANEVYNALRNLVANKTIVSYQQGYDGTHYFVTSQDSTMYGINFSLPVIANPVYKLNNNYSGYQYIFGQY